MVVPIRFRFTALAVATALTLAACGGGDTASAPTVPSVGDTTVDADGPTGDATPVDPDEAFDAYTDCMRDNGIEMPESSDIAGGVVEFEATALDPETFDDAQAACGEILTDAFGEFELSPEEEAEQRDMALAFARCMRDEGIDWPDPGTENAAIIEFGDTSVDQEAFDEALQTCNEATFGGSTGEGGVVFVGPRP